MKYNLWKNESKTIFCCLERALWKCTEGMIEICKLSRFWPISNFRILAKIKTCWNFWILFLKAVHQKGLLEQKKKVEVLLLSPDSWKVLTISLKVLWNPNDIEQILELWNWHKWPSLWQEYHTTYEIHSLFQLAAGPSADKDKKRFRHKQFPNFWEKSFMQSTKSFAICWVIQVFRWWLTTSCDQINTHMYIKHVAIFACAWWDARMFGRWKFLASQSHTHFWRALKT